MEEKIFNYKKNERYFCKSSGYSFPLNLYISDTYGKAPVCFSADDVFTEGALNFLNENAKLVTYSCNGKLETTKNYLIDSKGASYIYFYKDIFVSVNKKTQDDNDSDYYADFVSHRKKNKKEDVNKKLFNLSFKGPVGCKFPVEDFIPFIFYSDDPQINIFVKNSYGEYTFEPLGVKIPDNLDLNLNYGGDFAKISNSIITKLNDNANGLFMFHGPSGTGKSTFIKYLATKVNRDFIYIPNTMLDTFTTDPSCLQMLIQKSNSVLVLEDAEKLIMKRHGDSLDTSSVSTILNMSDGIMGDILNISIIITYNCDAKEIDPALTRKGRMRLNYKFDLLTLEQSVKLAEFLKYPKKLIEEKIKEPMSLADIYNLMDIVTFEPDFKNCKKIGF